MAYLKSIHFRANPNRRLDDTLPPGPTGASARDGERIFHTQRDMAREGANTFRCVDCHAKPSGSGSFGFTGLIGQPTKAAQLRGLNERTVYLPGTRNRISGFGFGADGSKEDLVAYLAQSHRFGKLTLREKESLQRYLFALPTEIAPIVGFTQTVTAANVKSAAVARDLKLLTTHTRLGNCDLIVKGFLENHQAGLSTTPRRRISFPTATAGHR